MNVHHLELFYYVAKYEGVVAACRQMPYGIQQPAVSAQVAKLEEELGTRLFERRPFRLTAAGRTLYDFVAPFFGQLSDVEQVIRGQLDSVLRIAGLTEVMRGHVPTLLGKLRREHPGLKMTLQEIDQRGAEKLISEGEADLAITVLESRLPPGLKSKVLARLPLCLLVPADSEYEKATEALKAGAADQVPLVSLPPHEMLPRIFQKELARRKLSWRTTMETNSQDLIAIYVKSGLGAGLAVMTPEIERDKLLRVLPLTGFPTLPIGAFWRGKLTPIASSLIGDLEARSRELLG